MPEETPYGFIITRIGLQIKEGGKVPVKMRIHRQSGVFFDGLAEILAERDLMLMSALNRSWKQPARILTS